jgi:meiotic recombination protein SPO11
MRNSFYWVSGTLIENTVNLLVSSCLYLLIWLVEKDAAFMRLAEDRFYNTYPCIIMTAKGQPDVASRLFLKRIKTELNLPVLGLVGFFPVFETRKVLFSYIC